MLIAAAIQLDTRTVVLMLLVAGAIALAIALVFGALGVAFGVGLARASAGDELPERRGSKLLALLGGTGATIAAWILLGITPLPNTPAGGWLVFVAGIPPPVVWGWWYGRGHHFRARPTAVPPGAWSRT